MDPLKPDADTLCKLGSAIRHAEEGLSPNGDPMDLETFHALAAEPSIVEWMREMDNLSLLPVKR